MSCPEFVRPPRWTALILVLLSALPFTLAACAKAKRATKRETPTIPSVDPVELAEQPAAAPSSSAGFDAFHRAFTLHDAGCTGGDFIQCVDLGIDYETG